MRWPRRPAPSGIHALELQRSLRKLPVTRSDAREPVSARIRRDVAARRGAGALLALLLLALACGDPTGGSEAPAELRIAGGAGQQGQVATELSSPLSVQVLGASGRGIADVAVSWAVASGGGTVTALTARTDANGLATARWVLGRNAGPQSVTATVSGLSPATFTATALPGPATSLVPVDGQLQSAGVGMLLARPLVVEARDAYDNPVPGVAVTWSVVEGGGSVSPQTSITGPDGRASTQWTLGTLAGDNHQVRATLPGGQTATFFATALVGAPAAILIEGGQDQVAAAGAELPEQLRIRVVDDAGNSVPGVAVTWQTSSGGVFRSASTQTDASGRATAFWRLGPTPTDQSATVEVAGLAPVTFTARGFAAMSLNSPLTGLSGLGGTRSYYRVQLGTATSRLTIAVPGGAGRVTVRARRDAFPTPQLHDCDAAPAPPGGDPTCVIQDAQPGDYYIALDALADFAGLELRATVALNIFVATAYITQAAQDWDGNVPLVAGRPGILRVFAGSTAPGIPAPPVRVTLYHGAVEVESRTLTKAGTIPDAVTTSLQGSFANSWNLLVPGELIQPGLAFKVELDPDDEIADDDPSDDVLPRGNDVRVVDVVEPPPFRVTFVPVFSSVTGLQGRIGPENVEAFLAVARKVWPLLEIDWEIRDEPIAVDMSMLESAHWSILIDRLADVRQADGNPARHYYGVVQFPPVQGRYTVGVGQVGGRIAAGIDLAAQDYRAWVAAHEWGHNFGRHHAPCGLDPAAPFDQSYPYADGRIGIYGVDVRGTVATSVIIDPDDAGDVMGYCDPRWISDYSFVRALQFRQLEGATLLAMEGDVRSAAPGPVLRVSGRVRDGIYELDPAFRMEGRPLLPVESGPYTLDGFDQDGTRLFTLSFDATPLGDVDEDVRHFGFAIPEELAPADRLHELRFSGPGGEAVRVAAGPATAGPPALPPSAARRAAGSPAEVRWDATTYPAVIVRNAATGRLIGFGESGLLLLPDAPEEIEITFSDGVRSWTHRLALPR